MENYTGLQLEKYNNFIKEIPMFAEHFKGYQTWQLAKVCVGKLYPKGSSKFPKFSKFRSGSQYRRQRQKCLFCEKWVGFKGNGNGS